MKKSLIVYFSQSSNTRRVAQILQKLTGADLEEIRPVSPYAEPYEALTRVVKDELQRGFLRPIEALDRDLSQYDTIFLGSPNWWSTVATPVRTFLNRYSLEGKTVAPFLTHGGGGKGNADRDVKKLCTGQILEMLALYEDGGSRAEGELSAWLQKIGFAAEGGAKE